MTSARVSTILVEFKQSVSDCDSFGPTGLYRPTMANWNYHVKSCWVELKANQRLKWLLRLLPQGVEEENSSFASANGLHFTIIKIEWRARSSRGERSPHAFPSSIARARVLARLSLAQIWDNSQSKIKRMEYSVERVSIVSLVSA